MTRGTIVNTQELSLVSGDPVLFCRHIAGGMTPDQASATYPGAALVPLSRSPAPPTILLCDACLQKILDMLQDDETASAVRDGAARLSRSASARTRRRGVR